MKRKTSGLSISVYFSICFGLIFLVASILVIVIVNFQMRKEALSDAEDRTNLLLERNLATHHYFSQELKPKLFDTIAGNESEDYFEPTWMSSTYAIRQIDKYFEASGEYNDYYYKECAIDARSPENEADDYERAFIEELNKKPELLAISEIRKYDGEAYLVTLRRGEMMEESCLRCHSTPENAPGDLIAQYGSQRSFNRSAGDTVSAVSIRIPLAKAYEATRATTIKLSVLLTVILGLMLSVIYFFTKKIILQPLRIIEKKSSQIAFDPERLGEKIPLPFSKELGGLVSAFNNMSVKLQDNRDNLEQKITQRTSQLEDVNKKLVIEIDEHKQSEQALRQSEERFRRAVLDAPLPIMIHAEDGEVLQISKVWTELTGYTHHEIPTLSAWTQRAYGERKDIIKSRIDKLFTHDTKVEEGEYVISSKDGKTLIWDFSSAPLGKLPDGRRLVISMAMDVTERKHFEEELKTQSYYLEKAQEIGNIGTWELDIKKNELIWTDENYRIFGVAIGTPLTYESFANCIHPDDRDYVVKEFSAALNGKPYDIEHRVVSNGEIKWVREKAEIEFGEDGKGIRALGFTQDITERKQVQNALIISERDLTIRTRIANIFLTVPDDRMYFEVLKIVLEVMESEFGVFGYLDEKGNFTVPTMTRHIWSKCQVPDKKIVFQRDTWGDSTWPEAIRQKKTIYSNKPSTNIPQGHIGIQRHISIPIVFRDKVIGLFQVANKVSDYTENDLKTIQYITEIVAPVLYTRLQRYQIDKDRKQAENVLRSIVEGTSKASEKDFFNVLVKSFVNAFNFKYVIAGELVAKDRVKTLAVWGEGDFAENFEYNLAGTPCENVINKGLCFYPGKVQEQFPTDQMLVKMGVENYLGTPLFDESGKTLGILAVMGLESAEDASLARKILPVFAKRASVELERKQAEEQIKNMAKFPSENPNPVLRIAKNGVLLYANDASSSLLAEWNCQEGKIVPEDWRQTVSKAFTSGLSKRVEIKHADRTFAFMVIPILDAGYANLYARDVTDRKQAEDELAKANNKLEIRVQERTDELATTVDILQSEVTDRMRLEREVLEISEEEQRRIGSELHDGLQQELVGIRFQCKLLTQELTDRSPAEANRAEKMHSLLYDAIEHTRAITRMLYPIEIDSKDISFALEQLASRVKDLFSVSCQFTCEKSLVVKRPEVAMNIYRIVQEAVTNAIKHGKADNISIKLKSNKHRITFTVKDNGTGLSDDHDKTKGMGLRIMKYRASMLGASLNITANTEDSGTLITCSFEIGKDEI